MPKVLKVLIGLVFALAAAWVFHGPLGTGDAFVTRLETEAREIVKQAEMQRVRVRFEHAPLSRTAILSGDANDFQREGMGSLPGLNDLVGGIPGVAGTRWSDDPAAAGGVPMIAEVLGMTAIAYAIGLLLGALLFGRKKREGYL